MIAYCAAVEYIVAELCKGGHGLVEFRFGFSKFVGIKITKQAPFVVWEVLCSNGQVAFFLIKKHFDQYVVGGRSLTFRGIEYHLYVSAHREYVVVVPFAGNFFHVFNRRAVMVKFHQDSQREEACLMSETKVGTWLAIDNGCIGTCLLYTS